MSVLRVLHEVLLLFAPVPSVGRMESNVTKADAMIPSLCVFAHTLMCSDHSNCARLDVGARHPTEEALVPRVIGTGRLAKCTGKGFQNCKSGS